MSDPLQSETMSVEVVYALPQQQSLLSVQVPLGTTAMQAVELSGVLAAYPEIEPTKAKLGIFGKLTKADTVLQPRDRVEIYRPLIADPKEVRKKRAAEGKKMKKGGGEAQ